MHKDIPVLYEDQQVVAFDKPAGILSIANDKERYNDLVSLVNRQYKDRHQGDLTQGGLHPVHRLDRDTSGVILFAKGKKQQQRLMEEFRQRKVAKTYIAFVHGHLKDRQGEIRQRIKDHFQKKYLSAAPAQMAITQYRVTEERSNFSVLEVVPLTGRTNQIRLHFLHLGHPLVGEDKYAFRRDFALKFKRTALHALQLQWENAAGKSVRVTAPIPRDMVLFLERNT